MLSSPLYVVYKHVQRMYVCFGYLCNNIVIVNVWLYAVIFIDTEIEN